MAFLTDILTGMILGSGYDLLKAIRKKADYTIISIVCDVMFWLFSCGLILFVFFLTNDMKLRAYEFFGILSGVLLYFTVFSAPLGLVYEKIADIFHFFCKILFTSVHFFGIIVKNGVLFLGKPFVWSFRFLKKLLQAPKRAWKENMKLIKRI